VGEQLGRPLITQALITQALITQALITQALITQALITQALITCMASHGIKTVRSGGLEYLRERRCHRRTRDRQRRRAVASIASYPVAGRPVLRSTTASEQ